MNDFLCPNCNDHLRVGEHLVFKVKNSRKQSGLLLLHPQIGNYSSIKHPSFSIKKGEVLEYYCPLCNSALKSGIHPNLALVNMIDEDGKIFAVYFSQVAGEQSTYETIGDTVHATGDDAGKYTYFKLGDKFKKYI